MGKRDRGSVERWGGGGGGGGSTQHRKEGEREKGGVGKEGEGKRECV